MYNLIKVKNLYHSYTNDDKYAVKNITFDVEERETLGFLGPSGAGKSTTQGVMTGILPLQKGEVKVGEFNLSKRDKTMFNNIGVSFEQSNVYGKLTALENLEFYRKLFDGSAIDPMTLLKQVGLDQVADKRADTFSKGMKHRLTFARSMINQPQIWFLDEPTTGLDPAIASQIKQIIKERKASGTTILLTTHNMVLADELSDKVGFIIDGQLKLVDTPRNLKLRYGEKLVQVEYKTEDTVKSELLSMVDEQERKRLGDIIHQYEIETMHTREATLEEIFIKVTGRGLV